MVQPELAPLLQALQDTGLDSHLQTLDGIPAFQAFESLRLTMSEFELLSLSANTYKLPFEPGALLNPDPELRDKIGVLLMQQVRFLPLYEDDNQLAIAVDNPFGPFWDILGETYSQLDIRLICQADLDQALQSSDMSIDIPTVLSGLLKLAVEEKASDLHLTLIEHGLLVRLRINGNLQNFGTKSSSEADVITSLIKLHAHMDISLSQKPQDGRLEFNYQLAKYDIRVSSLPTAYGEDFVLRFFEDKPPQSELAVLGFSPASTHVLHDMLSQKSGLILITGATGSGKTTTLYTCLQWILTQRFCNIVTLEDPIETHLPGIRQSQINPAIGYKFEQGLRAVLRQDPDVIMIGEIRDKDTARTALEAAYTGHLVLSTLHTPDCASTLLRLAHFDLDPFWVQFSLLGVVSQTLIPKLCPECSIPGQSIGKLSAGCDKCRHSGRIVLNEILRPDPKAPFSDVLDPKKALYYSDWTADLAYKIQQGWVSESTVV
jgi:type II secretory ATPase GspE/PulE/Tfp pilus assembly ATPase PilB-like protein